MRAGLVEDDAQAKELCFPGSPTIRVNGRDVEPGADERDGHALACRVYLTPDGPRGVPEAHWIVAALESAGA